VLRLPLYPSHDSSAVRRALNYGSFAAAAVALGIPQQERADVCYVINLPTVALAASVQKLVRGTPFVYNIPDIWPEAVTGSGMLRGPVQKVAEGAINALNRVVHSRAAAMTVISPGFKRILVERGVPEEKVAVVYNWVDEELFRPVPRDETLARELGFASKFNVLYAGNLGSFQGLESAVRAATRLRAFPEIQLVLLGEGQEKEALQQLARELGARNVRFLERRPLERMPAINALADALLVHLKEIPLLDTWIPSKTQVSLASGRPIVMAARGDAGELIERAEAGVVCAPEDPEALANAIVKLYRMPVAERERLGKNGREFYLREMSLEVGGKRIEQLFERVAVPA
jgi:putative colanic acid biosynthesis glycosyltransferase WcaI